MAKRDRAYKTQRIIKWKLVKNTLESIIIKGTIMYGNRFKLGNYCNGCFFYAGFCLASGNTITKLPCEPVDRLSDSFRPSRKTNSLPKPIKGQT